MPHLFACGEVAGSHGVYRPGGSALNAGQVGSMRCAQYISKHQENQLVNDFDKVAGEIVSKHIELTNSILSSEDNVSSLTDKYQRKMDEIAGPIRDASRFEELSSELSSAILSFNQVVKVNKESKLWLAYRLRDALLAERLYVSAMELYVRAGGKSRGSAIYSSENGQAPEKMEDVFRFELDNGDFNDQIFELTLKGTDVEGVSRPVRPLPEGGGFFENVWRDYRETKNIY